VSGSANLSVSALGYLTALTDSVVLLASSFCQHYCSVWLLRYQRQTIIEALTMFETVTFMDNGMIRVVKEIMNIPDDMSLAERQRVAKWEDDGNSIAAFLPPAPRIESVSARQFKLQLLAAGLLVEVDAWITL